MRGFLVRIGVDQKFGQWNAPVDPATGEFVYVPIPEPRECRRGMETPYALVEAALALYAARHDGARMRDDVTLPAHLSHGNMHLDPDFARLTYGDTCRRGAGLVALGSGDVIAFFAGLRATGRERKTLVYAIVGLYRVEAVTRVGDIVRARWRDNAHTRRLAHRADDVVVRARRGSSGRLTRCLPIGEWRDGAYRVRRDLLQAWGGLKVRDGYVQRSAVPPAFLSPERFLSWFDRQGVELVAENNPDAHLDARAAVTAAPD